ncbi:hypothetical protein B0I35DRAFT_514056 [Stachybotrys elegans]|uniref:Uncharacterized protein n=1 Tax=Stachybotrys elegans TaxID=80388 RepID=A0A8K0SFT0_9HYPO|nr:hypothetical protein B0I35DRAFT_514056 [Stachybotrys elegans]
MTYQDSDPYSQPQPQAIFLYTAPLRNQRKLFKKPVDVIGHWAVCIDGWCYELTRNGEGANKTEPKYSMKPSTEQAWLEKKRRQERLNDKVLVGYTTRYFSPTDIETIAQLVWQKSLRGKYVVDENNCQVFVRLLIELIGDPTTKVNFPSYFDKWVKTAGISRDAAVLLFAAGASTIAATASLAATPVDPTGTAAAGFAISTMNVLRTTSSLILDRRSKEKFIEKSQKELRAQLGL